VANKHGKAKPQEGGKIKVRDKAEEALQQSEQEYRTILENIVEGYTERPDPGVATGPRTVLNELRSPEPTYPG